MSETADATTPETPRHPGRGDLGGPRPRPRKSRRNELPDPFMSGARGFRRLLDRLPGFRIMMAGSSISMFGSRISTIAFPMLVLHLNNSPFIAGLVTCAAVAPSMLAYIPAGALVDRSNPRKVMLISELLRGIAIASIIIVIKMFGKHTYIYLLVLVMVAEEILEIFSVLADRRYLNQLVDSEKIDSSQAYIEVRTHAVVLAGRPIGPFLFAIRPLLPFLADAVSFLFSVGSLALLGGKERVKGSPPDGPDSPPRGQLRSEIYDGFKWLIRDYYAITAMALMACTTLIAQALIMMFLVQAHTKMLSTVAIGAVLAASGAGGALGSLIAGKLPVGAKMIWLRIQMCAWSIALGVLAISGAQSAWFIAIAMLVLGFTGAIGNIAFSTYLVRTADRMLARVTSIGQVMVIGASALGPFLGGIFIQGVGLQGAMRIFLVVVLIMTFVAFSPPIKSDQAAPLADVAGEAGDDSLESPSGHERLVVPDREEKNLK
jgi:MFS family permease